MRDTVIYIRANGHYQVLKKVRMRHTVIYESLNMVKFMTGKECVKNISIHYPNIILFRLIFTNVSNHLNSYSPQDLTCTTITYRI